MAAQVLLMKCTVYLPENTSDQLLDTFKKAGADVIMFGRYYPDVLKKAKEAIEVDKNA